MWPLQTLKSQESEVLEQLRQLTEGKAAGPDGIPTKVLKSCAAQLTKPLTIFFKRSLQLGKQPSEWKRPNITPIFKKGSRCKAENYRPVSLTSQVCKILERVILKYIKSHLMHNRLVSTEQHEFQMGISCQTNLLEALELWKKWLDEGKGVDIAYLDFQKAFDKAPHLRLTRKLEAHGIRGSVLHWICDFLSDRSQQVVIGSSTSSSSRVISGVP